MRRLQVATRLFAAAAVVLTGIFAGVAAGGNSGRKHVRLLRVRRPATSPVGHQTYRAPPPPSLPPLSPDGQGQPTAPSQSPAPPTQTPAPSYSPPAVVSGGS